MKYKRVISICMFVIALILCLVISIITFDKNIKQIKVGVIDTNMSNVYVSKHNICNIMNDTKSLSSNITHSDMVVDVIRERDNNCQIYLANVLQEDNTGYITDVVDAIYWLAENKVDVICMSFTAFENNEELQAAISTVQTKGIIVVAACLNYSYKATYPANYPGVISVANCSNDNATICVLDKKIKDKLKNSKWGECSTSILTAYITGEISSQMSKSNLKLDKCIQKYNK